MPVAKCSGMIGQICLSEKSSMTPKKKMLQINSARVHGRCKWLHFIITTITENNFYYTKYLHEFQVFGV